MGAGNKLDPCQFEITDISKTTVCPLARVMRQECKKRGIKDVKVLYSKEKVLQSTEAIDIGISEAKQREAQGLLPGPQKKSVPGSTAFVPSVAGLIIAGEVIKDLIK